MKGFCAFVEFIDALGRQGNRLLHLSVVVGLVTHHGTLLVTIDNHVLQLVGNVQFKVLEFLSLGKEVFIVDRFELLHKHFEVL